MAAKKNIKKNALIDIKERLKSKDSAKNPAGKNNNEQLQKPAKKNVSVNKTKVVKPQPDNVQLKNKNTEIQPDNNQQQDTTLAHSEKLSRNPMKQNKETQNNTAKEPENKTGEVQEHLSDKEKKELENVVDENKGADDLPDFNPNENFNPYDKDTIKRPHSQAQMELTDEQKANPIAPPAFEKPKQEDFDAGKRSMQEETETQPPYIQPDIQPDAKMKIGGTVSPAPEPDDKISEPPKKEKLPRAESRFEKETKDVFNPKMEEEATPEEKKIRREMLVDTLYDGYDMMHRVARHFAKISDEKLQDMEMEGKIAMDMEIDVSDNETRTIYEVIKTFNGEIDRFMRVDKDFINKTKPSLLRICEKHGWGMSDELNLAIQVSKDLATKISVGYQMVAGMNRMLKVASKIYMEKHQKVEDKINEEQQPAEPPPPPAEIPQKPEKPAAGKGKKDKNIETALTIISPDKNDKTREPEEKQ